jgi:hydrogenase maturation protein HypF
LSQHLGDLDSIESETVYRETFQRMTTFFGIDPSVVVCDLHPLYFPTRCAEAYAKEREAKGLPVRLLYAQHHHAHIASVMAEHALAGPVIGVAFDGTGYGTDGAIWGGEILLCEGANFERFSHLKYVKMLGGDASAREAWKSAASHLATLNHPPATEEFELDLSPYAAFANTYKNFSINGHPENSSEHRGTFCLCNPDYTNKTSPCVIPEAVFADAETAIRSGVGCITSSSMGRLFDAVASMLDVCHENRYEGECASMLENAATRAISDREKLALRFHLDVARAILDQCTKARTLHNINKVCLSGGVFQNRVLMEETLRLLRADCFDVYYNIHVPPNDGGIALGQCYLGMFG